MWDFQVKNSNKAQVSDFECKNQNDKFCQQAYNYMINDFQKLVLSFDHKNEHIYDQPASMRQLVGFLNYINDFTQRPIETLHVEASSKSIIAFFNCKESSIKEVLN